MRLSIATKITASMIAGVAMSCLSVLVISTWLLNKTFDDQLSEHIRVMRGVMEKQIANTAEKFFDAAVTLSGDASLAESVIAGDKQAMLAQATRLMAVNHADFFTITDTKGIVLARAHAPGKSGDSIAGQETVKRALRGEASVGVVEGTEIAFSLRAGAPLRHNGEIIGTLGLGTSLASPAYVDDMKKTAGMDVTFFKGDTRVVSTIVKDGQRIIGTKLDNPGIADAVLARGETVYQDASILGTPYKTAYWPIRGLDGAILGINFMGAPVGALEQSQRNATYLTLLGAFGILLLLGFFAVLFARVLARPIKNVNDYAVKVSNGDMEARLDVRATDEVGTLADALRIMVKNLKDKVAEAEAISNESRAQAARAEEAMLHAEQSGREAQAKGERMLQTAAKLEEVGQVLSSASHDLAGKIRQAEEGASAQAGKAAETATAMAEMNVTVIDVARNAADAADISAHTRQKATEGAHIVEEVVGSIQRAQQDSLALKGDMVVLGEHARSISQIMGVISDIADQTNLLALNAAIEAARAGEAGRGFAVVADEVRKLAEKTMASTSDVSRAVNAIRVSMDKSMEQVDVTVKNIEYATALAVQSGGSLNEIVEMTGAAAGQVHAIAAASEEQSATSEAISYSVGTVNDIAGETALAMRAAGQSVTSLAAQANILASLIKEMRQE